MAGTYDIVIDQGADYSLGITLKDSNNVPLDLTLYNARGHLRPKKDSTSLTATFICEVLVPNIDGKINISLSNSTTKSIEAGTYYYDIEIYTASDAYVERILQGKAKITQEVTR